MAIKKRIKALSKLTHELLAEGESVRADFKRLPSDMFATTRTSNDIMQEMLVQLKFSEDGAEYRSEQNPVDTVKLFVRSAPQIQEK